jgi:hypothetical protein
MCQAVPDLRYFVHSPCKKRPIWELLIKPSGKTIVLKHIFETDYVLRIYIDAILEWDFKWIFLLLSV